MSKIFDLSMTIPDVSRGRGDAGPEGRASVWAFCPAFGTATQDRRREPVCGLTAFCGCALISAISGNFRGRSCRTASHFVPICRAAALISGFSV